MTKNVLITSYFTTVVLRDFPKSFRKKEEYRIVGLIQAVTKGVSNSQLYNVSRYVNSQIYADKLEFSLYHALEVNYDDYKAALDNDEEYEYLEKVARRRI
ncbi:MAG: hypothetical protein ACRDB0_05005 [Paraclostridium sp.]